MNKINLLSNPKNERFSIRKMSISVCSVVLGLVLINSINSNQIVLAEGNENNVEIKNEKNTSEFSNLVANGDFSQINSKRENGLEIQQIYGIVHGFQHQTMMQK